MSKQTQLFAQNGKWAVKAPPPQLDTSANQVGLLRRPTSAYYDMYPTQHPDTYGKWVDSLRQVACVPTYEDECKAFYFGDLFDELVLANHEACNDSNADDGDGD